MIQVYRILEMRSLKLPRPPLKASRLMRSPYIDFHYELGPFTVFLAIFSTSGLRFRVGLGIKS